MAISRQAAGAVLMIRPVSFDVNTQTAQTNRFQNASAHSQGRTARAEVDAIAAALADAGIHVEIFDDLPEPPKPDAVFPNNWISFHADGRVVLYPMLAPNRRAERRADIVDSLTERGWDVREIVDLSHLEHVGSALEGTGSLVLDRPCKLAYAAISERTTPDALSHFEQATGYRVHSFQTSYDGAPVYHTNVMLALGSRFAIVCDEAIDSAAQRTGLLEELERRDRDVIRIDRQQMANFAANLLELGSPSGPRIVLSARAHQALSADQRRKLARHGSLLVVDMPTIESGGGSLRCTLAEIFLSRSSRPDS
jgi:hypothetical protein